MSDSRPPVPSSADSAGSATPAGAPPARSEWLRAELGALSAMLPPSADAGGRAPGGSATDLLRTLQAALGEGLELERELGGGGMSRVFVAIDTTLGRRVAVKVLAPELLQGVSAERFAREVALAARLQDPHIVPVLTTGATAGGIPYYTMPFIEGESLRGRMQRAQELGAPVPLDEALRILRDVAEALEYAHARGVVHRDIKPENVLLSGRNALVADFGIAKAMTVVRDAAVRDSASHSTSGRAVAGGTLTSVGLSLGTPGYMAPEQAGGDVVDHRADLYAWGIMAWELLAGRHPFVDKQSAAQLMAAQLAEMPCPLDEVRPGLPPSLGALVMRCVAKLPAERPADVAAVLAALGGATTDLAVTSGRRAPVLADASRHRTPVIAAAVLVVALGVGGVWWGTRGKAAAAASAANAAPSIAVLPFEHQGDTANTYLTDGITDEIRNKLTGVPNLVVIARASSMQYKGKTTSPQQIAKELGVRWLLTGTVRVLGTGDQRRVLVRPELVEVTADGRLQSKGGTPFDGPLTDVVKAQGEVASQVVSSMEVAVGGVDQAKLVQVATKDPVAYDLYLRARAAMDFGAAGDQEALRAALPLLEQAVARDSLLLEAWSELARVRAFMHGSGPNAVPAAATRAAVERIRRLDGDGAFSLRARAWEARYVARNEGEAASLLTRAAALMPGDAEFVSAAATAKALTGDYGPAMAGYEQATRLDPRNVVILRNLAVAQMRLGRIDDARRTAQRARELAPGAPTTLGTQVIIELAAGDTARARRLLDDAARTIPIDRLLKHFIGSASDWLLPRAAVHSFFSRDPAETFDGDRADWALTQADLAFAWGDSSAARAWGDTARRAYEARRRATPAAFEDHQGYGTVLAYTGRTKEAMREARLALAAERRAAASPRSYTVARQLYFATTIAVAAGDREAALAWLTELRGIPSQYTAAFLRIDPFLAPLRGDPRFIALLATPDPR